MTTDDTTELILIDGVACAAPADMSVEGIFDRFKSIGDALELWRAIQSKDVSRIRAAVVQVAIIVGYPMDAKEIDEVVTKIIAKSLGGIVYEMGDYQMKFAVAHLGYVPDNAIRLMARADIRTMSRDQAKQWLADNAANVREGRERRGIRWALRNAPEVLAALDGTPTANVAMTPERAEQIINILNWAIALSTVAGMFFPPALVVSTALRGIQVYLKSLFPEVSSVVEGFVADGVERGLALEDFAVVK